MQKGKSPGLDGLIVEFFIGFYDLLKENMLKMVQEWEGVGTFELYLSNSCS
jgi:hypothetical protein